MSDAQDDGTKASTDPADRTIGDIVREALAANCDVQCLHDTMTGVRPYGRRRKHEPPNSLRQMEVSFATTQVTPDHLLWLSGQMGRTPERKPPVLGIVVWVPMEIYEGK